MSDNTRLPDGLYGNVRVVFSDLDGTLYPGAHEDDPQAELKGLTRNMGQVSRLERMGVPVIPTTGNNVSQAQAKFMSPSTGEKLRDLSSSPGIYCNGALVKGRGGIEVEVSNVNAFVPSFIKAWIRGQAPRCEDVLVTATKRHRISCLQWEGNGPGCIRTLNGVVETFGIPEEERPWVRPQDLEDLIAAGEDVLSLVLYFPIDWAPQDTINMQAWFQSAGLIDFSAGAGVDQVSEGEGDGVILAHIRVPGIGPEIDIRPAGVNKGAAVAKLLQNPQENFGFAKKVSNAEIAVFGDSHNDIELFGMQLDCTGRGLVPLGSGFRPGIRCAQPWSNSSLLKDDATVVARMERVLRRIADDVPQNNRRTDPAPSSRSGASRGLRCCFY